MPNGNIKSKTGLGNFYYGSGLDVNAGLHALVGVEDTTGLINHRGQQAGYTNFGKVAWVVDSIGTDAYRLDITYGPDQQRWKTVLQKNGNVIKTVIFSGDYERITENGVTRELYYIGGNAIVVKTNGINTMYYIHPDHLGSFTVITDVMGNVVQKCTFDAWGNRQFVVKDPALVFDRGYTGHEHLDEFGLINMNGRMYDPIVGRFLSPDPFVQVPDFSQSFNRYSYAWNNPLIYTDPSGELIGEIFFIGAMIYIGGLQNNFMYAADNGGSPFNPGNWNWKNPWTYISMAASGFSAYAQIGGWNGLSNTATATTAPASNTSDPTSWIHSPELAEFFPRSSWLNSGTDRFNLLANIGGKPGKPFPQYNWLSDVFVYGNQSSHARTMINTISVRQAGAAFWGHPITKGVTTLLTTMVGGGIFSGMKYAYTAVKGYRYADASIGGAKAIAQFSGRTIDDAVSLVMKDANKLNHLFPAKHNLGGLVNKLGGQENTIRAVLNAANGKLPASGVFNNIPVSVGGQTVFIRGSVINGVPRLGTMYIP